VDIANCDREPIHIPGLIQSHGALLAFREPECEVEQVSENVEAYLGYSVEAVLGRPLPEVLGDPLFESVRRTLADIPGEGVARFVTSHSRVQGERALRMDVIVHRNDGLAILELDGSRSMEGVDVPGYYRSLSNPLAALTEAASQEDLARAAAREARRITGFDRVMIYRFDRHWNGEVVAEEREEGMPPYLGLQYPASDIPVQARELYSRNWLRIIPDADYAPVPLRPLLNPGSGRPLDLSHALLRSVSPIHIAYLKNMGVAASMSVSVILNGRLWGLISCHHRTPRFITHEMRLACEFMGQAFSLRLSALQLSETERYRRGLKERIGLFRGTLRGHTDLLQGLAEASPALQDFLGADGSAILYEGEYRTSGSAPGEAEVRALCAWLDSRGEDGPYATDSLPREFPLAEGFAGTASGALALCIPTTVRNYMLWFKPEVIRTVRWAGNPEKPAEAGPGGAGLSPRRSFELWKQTVRFTSRPWKDLDIEAAQDIKNIVVARALERTAESLAASNAELDAFAYAASHDLKEPLRGIRNYSRFLEADLGATADKAVLDKLAVIQKLTTRMEGLIHALFEHSRLGKTALQQDWVDLNAVVAEIRESLGSRPDHERIDFVVHGPLPNVTGDRVILGQVFSNLVENAIKYNDKPRKRVEIGTIPAEVRSGKDAAPTVFFVRDNGIGIPERHFENVFRMFRRLHGREKFGGGYGAGLAIVKRIVERHGGRIWLESVPGEGSTFYFNLEA
jgi:light-regulated signal transduction histidine kinase (bacteriophytochrome)